MSVYLTIKKLFFGSIITLLIASSCSQHNKNTHGGLLWEITANELTEPSYLFGTNHGMSGDFVDSIPGFWDAFNSAKQFALEFDFTKPKRLDSIKPLDTHLPKNTSYPELLNEEELLVLDSTLTLLHSRVSSKEMNLVPGRLLWNLQLGLMKIESREWRKENPYLWLVPARKNIDSRLLKISKFRAYPIIELDTEEELERLGLRDMSVLFSSEKLQDRAKDMIQSIKEIEEENLMEIAKMGMQSYYEQDLKKLEEWDNHPKILKDKKAKSIHHTFVNQRNIFWMDKIMSSINKQSTFIMVGVAHLPGKEGIINLLRKEGYNVNPIN